VKIALAAFEPFGGRRVNRSALVLDRVAPVEGVSVDKTVLPVDFARLPGAIDALLAARPDAVVLMGEARRPNVSVERIALNVVDARIPDNRGERPVGTAVVPDGPLALRSTWNADAVVRAVGRAGVPVEASDHAGTFACNAALYLAVAHAVCPVGFLHVPARRWPLGPSLARLARAVETALAAIRDG
jgi:pyroglutamyl-peptidase